MTRKPRDQAPSPTNAPHLPVMLDEVLEWLSPAADERIVDGTFGAGGYTRAILGTADCTVFAIDRDPTAVARGRDLAATLPGRLHILQGCFGDMQALLKDAGIDQVDGIVLDLGVSSMQLDQAERGFSFRFDGPLDMRMGDSGPTAADVVNTAGEKELADIIFNLGEERHSRRVAKAIVEARKTAPILRTAELANIVRSVVRQSKDGIDPATRTFQALRIHVNDELGEIDRGLDAAAALLAPGGRLVVVSFHSLEDRRVKMFLRKLTGGDARPSRHQPLNEVPEAADFKLLTRRAVAPTEAETRNNPRARSARLRAAQRLAA